MEDMKKQLELNMSADAVNRHLAFRPNSEDLQASTTTAYPHTK